jgi:hypothetical protein
MRHTYIDQRWHCQWHSDASASDEEDNGGEAQFRVVEGQFGGYPPRVRWLRAKRAAGDDDSERMRTVLVLAATGRSLQSRTRTVTASGGAHPHISKTPDLLFPFFFYFFLLFRTFSYFFLLFSKKREKVKKK